MLRADLLCVSPLLISICLLGGCAFGKQETPATPAPSASAATSVDYQCDRGEPIRVVFLNAEGTAQLMRNGDTVLLDSVPTGSGFNYSNKKTTIRGKGSELILEVGRMAPIRCEADEDLNL